MTLAQLEAVLVSRGGAMMTYTGLAATPSTDSTPRAYLGESIAYALSYVGIWTVDPTVPTTAEVEKLPNGTQRSEVIDRAELRVMETCLASFTEVTEKDLEAVNQYSDYAASLLAQITAKAARILAAYPSKKGAC